MREKDRPVGCFQCGIYSCLWLADQSVYILLAMIAFEDLPRPMIFLFTFLFVYKITRYEREIDRLKDSIESVRALRRLREE